MPSGGRRRSSGAPEEGHLQPGAVREHRRVDRGACPVVSDHLCVCVCVCLSLGACVYCVFISRSECLSLGACVYCVFILSLRVFIVCLSLGACFYCVFISWSVCFLCVYLSERGFVVCLLCLSL